ncbi:phosphatidylserine decarboxylase 1 [Chytridiales sp. JEL 0842]|nr:phosphatidylserine decarboxylase 1 [Chytridiales sp. JEL 0842]
MYANAKLFSTDTFSKAKDAWFNTKTVWKPIPIGLGLALIGTLHMMRVKRRTEEEQAKRQQALGIPSGHPDLKIEGHWLTRLYGSMPLKEASALWGYIHSLTVPEFLRPAFYKFYSAVFGCNLDEMENPDLKSYPNLGDFFYRTLKPGARVFDKSAALNSPSDGRVLAFGPIENREVEHVKGITYSLDALLGRDGFKYQTPDSPALHDAPHRDDPSAKNAPKKGNKLFYCVIYLAPGDYHRFHAPVDLTVKTRRHFAGELLSVSPAVVEMIRNLFILNERVSLTGTWKHGYFAYIPVGATNVGSIKINFDPELKTNIPYHVVPQPLGTYSERHFDNLNLKQGDEMGGFRFGSTVVLVFEAPEKFEFKLEKGQKVKVGEGIGYLSK